MSISQPSLIFVIFGASGDLSRRKLIPALYSLFVQKMLPSNFILAGVSRTPYDDERFREAMKKALLEAYPAAEAKVLDSFLRKLHYLPFQYDDSASYQTLKIHIEKWREKKKMKADMIFYLSTPPELFPVISGHLAQNGLSRQKEGFKRLIIEKPFGDGLESALSLKKELHTYWKEEQLFRIDHYLGKETVQNLLVTRFSNGIFEPVWSRNFIHHIEITSAEQEGIENRGGYYERAGALRDMVQNHLLQIAAIIAMEPPSSLEPDSIRSEISKVFRSLQPIPVEEVKNMVIRGQYLPATVRGRPVKGYREETGIPPDSTTETYAALKFYIDNWRWSRVPFYIRTGKRLPARVTEVVIHFKPTPHILFKHTNNCQSCNQLVLRIQPDEGILLKFWMKTPGAGFEVQQVNLDFHYADLGEKRIPSAYERLIYDAIMGDATLFARSEEAIEAWKFLAPVIEAWKTNKEIPLYGYPAGTWGPDVADDLIEGKDMNWRYPCKNLSDDGLYCEL